MQDFIKLYQDFGVRDSCHVCVTSIPVLSLKDSEPDLLTDPYSTSDSPSVHRAHSPALVSSPSPFSSAPRPTPFPVKPETPKSKPPVLSPVRVPIRFKLALTFAPQGLYRLREAAEGKGGVTREHDGGPRNL